MASSPISEFMQHLRSVQLLAEGAELTDGQLLECFLSRQEPAALEALVCRHGPMVWGVCRRILGTQHDAEDAFQATFLVLVRKAASVHPRSKDGSWLYGVARLNALKARAGRAKRRQRERPVTPMPEPAVTDPEIQSDLRAVLDEEIGRLPEHYREAVVQCELGGKTVKEAAKHLGCPEGTVGSRLARGRALLAWRLARHGLPVTAGALAGLLAQEAQAAVSAAVLRSTIRAATAVAAGQAAAGAVTSTAAALAEGVVKTMFLTKLKSAVTGLLLITALAGAAGLLYRVQAAQPPQAGRGQEPGAPGGGALPAQAADLPKAQLADQPDDEKLHGVWTMVSMKYNGGTLSTRVPEQAIHVVVKGGKITITRGGKPAGVWPYKVDPAKELKHIDIAQSDDIARPQTDGWAFPRVFAATTVTAPAIEPAKHPGEETFPIIPTLHEVKRVTVNRPGIYSLEGDTLRICVNATGTTRPTAFASEEGEDVWLWELKRAVAPAKGEK
jgi:RNA polymerase sigma factor (sigma-70 family)